MNYASGQSRCFVGPNQLKDQEKYLFFKTEKWNEWTSGMMEFKVWSQ